MAKADLQLIGSGGVKVGKTFLKIPATISIEEWIELGVVLREMQSSIQWLIGDWLYHGEKHFGEMASQVLEGTHLDYKTLMNWRWVASRIEPSRRRDNLSWSAHEEVAALEPKDQELVFSKAEKKGLTTKRDIRTLAGAVKGQQPKEQPQKHCPECGAILP